MCSTNWTVPTTGAYKRSKVRLEIYPKFENIFWEKWIYVEKRKDVCKSIERIWLIMKWNLSSSYIMIELFKLQSVCPKQNYCWLLKATQEVWSFHFHWTIYTIIKQKNQIFHLKNFELFPILNPLMSGLKEDHLEHAGRAHFTKFSKIHISIYRFYPIAYTWLFLPIFSTSSISNANQDSIKTGADALIVIETFFGILEANWFVLWIVFSTLNNVPPNAIQCLERHMAFPASLSFLWESEASIALGM